MVTHIGSSSSS